MVVKAGYPDHTSWDPQSDHYDPKSSPEQPRWYMVDIRLDKVFSELVPLKTLRQCAKLKKMALLQKGSRLSVQPVSKAEYETILGLATE